MMPADVKSVKTRWAVRKLLVSALAILSLSFMGTFMGTNSARAQNPPYQPPNSQQPQYGQPPSGQQSADGQQSQQMDTDAGVARASFIHGDVSMQRGDNN